jgi:chromate transporter
MSSLLEVLQLTFTLGCTAFGGPAAHIAMLRSETVERRGWLSEAEFLDMLGATNLIPGPNSTEMIMHVSHKRAGLAGMILGGVAFILPAMVLVSVLAWGYVRFGTLPQTESILRVIKPVVVVLIAQALWSLGQKAFKGWQTGLVGVGALGLYWLGVDEIILIAAGGLILVMAARVLPIAKDEINLVLPFIGSLGLQAAASTVRLVSLFWAFFKIGAVLYGSGYVLLAFMQSDLVEGLGWISQQQLIDAVAVGQVTPGPVFTTVTFVGYLLRGWPGALVATLGIFLPSFIFIGVTHPQVSRMRQLAWGASLLDGVNAVALALMAAVTLQLAKGALTDPLSIGLAAVAGVLLFRFKVKSLWLVLGAAGLGLILPSRLF